MIDENNARYTGVRKYVIKASCKTPLHIGNEYGDKDQVLVHPVDQIPLIPATGVAGAFADYIGKSDEQEKREKWFGHDSDTGKSGSKSRITFQDCIFEKANLRMELRPRIQLDGETGTVKMVHNSGNDISSGQITNMEYVASGAEFHFTIYQFIQQSEDEKVVERCLSALNHGDILLGGQLSTGCGEVKLISVLNANFDLLKEDGLKAWMREEEYNGTEILDQIQQMVQKKNNFYEVKIRANYYNSVLIKGNSVDMIKVMEVLNRKEPPKIAAAPMTNGKSKFIIPGSSFKGSVRSRIESIMDYLGLDMELGEKTFENRSKVYFYDAVLEEEGTARLIARTAINKMTGGVKNQALFFEMPIGGKTDLTIRIAKANGKNKRWTDADVKCIIGLLMLALRDFAVGAASFGGGASIGRGFADISCIMLLDGDETLIHMDQSDNQQIDEKKFMKSCLEALKARRKINDKNALGE